MLIAEHVTAGPCPGCGGMNPARYARMVGRVKCSMVGCPFTLGHLGRHASGSRKPTWQEAFSMFAPSVVARFAIDAHFHALFWQRLSELTTPSALVLP